MSEKINKEGQSSAFKSTLYKEAGIMEGHGKIPLWLKLVALGLMFWGVHYIIKYWNIG
jgi:hypothetical protein